LYTPQRFIVAIKHMHTYSLPAPTRILLVKHSYHYPCLSHSITITC